MGSNSSIAQKPETPVLYKLVYGYLWKKARKNPKNRLSLPEVRQLLGSICHVGDRDWVLVVQELEILGFVSFHPFNFIEVLPAPTWEDEADWRQVGACWVKADELGNKPRQGAQV